MNFYLYYSYRRGNVKNDTSIKNLTAVITKTIHPSGFLLNRGVFGGKQSMHFKHLSIIKNNRKILYLNHTIVLCTYNYVPLLRGVDDIVTTVSRSIIKSRIEYCSSS